MVKASFVQRLKCFSLQYSQSASFILPAHGHGGILSYRRIEKGKDQEKDGQRGDYKIIQKGKQRLRDKPSTTQKDSVKPKKVC